jgi:hypothetical protein
MKPRSLRSIGAVAGLLLASSGTTSAVVNLLATSTYDEVACADGSLAIISAEVEAACPAQNEIACAAETKVLATCTTDTTFKDDFATAFGDAPYIVKAEFQGDTTCAAGSLTSATAYAADGKCHSGGATGYFKVTAGAGGAEYVDHALHRR